MVKKLRVSRKRMITHYNKTISDSEVQELETFLEENYSPSVRMAYYFMKEMGVRPSEAVVVRLSDINWEARTVLIRAKKQHRIIERDIPPRFFERLWEHYTKYEKEIKRCQGFICWCIGHGCRNPHVSYNCMSWVISKFRHEKGYNTPYYIRADGRPLYRISLHVLRSRFITRFNEEASKTLGGNAIKLTQEIIGHKNIETTLGYVRIHDSRNVAKGVLANM